MDLFLGVLVPPPEKTPDATYMAVNVTAPDRPGAAVTRDAPKAGEAFQPGETLGERYKIVEQIGGGGMGEVYLAEHVVLGKPLAVKVLRRELSERSEFVERFKLEAIAASRIGHPNIVDVADFGKTPDGRFYFVMEYLPGQTLASLALPGQPMPPTQALTIASQLARALAAAHARGIIHRDVKPANVMLVGRGDELIVKLVDFGLVKPVTADLPRTDITREGLVLGTPDYMSPEQVMGKPLDHRSDIYSFGVLLYRLLSGEAPFRGDSTGAVVVAHVNSMPPPLPERTAAGPLPASLRTLVSRMLAKAPDDRLQSAVDVGRAIDACLAELRGMPPDPSTPLPLGITPYPLAGSVPVGGPRTRPTAAWSRSGATISRLLRPSTWWGVGVAAALIGFLGALVLRRGMAQPPGVPNPASVAAPPEATRADTPHASPDLPKPSPAAAASEVEIPLPAPTDPGTEESEAAPRPSHASAAGPQKTNRATHPEPAAPSRASLLATADRLEHQLRVSAGRAEASPVALQLLEQARRDAEDAKDAAARRSVARFLSSWEKKFLKNPPER